jgi:hypothetical protein
MSYQEWIEKRQKRWARKKVSNGETVRQEEK